MRQAKTSRVHFSDIVFFICNCFMVEQTGKWRERGDKKGVFLLEKNLNDTMFV